MSLAIRGPGAMVSSYIEAKYQKQTSSEYGNVWYISLFFFISSYHVISCHIVVLFYLTPCAAERTKAMGRNPRHRNLASRTKLRFQKRAENLGTP